MGFDQEPQRAQTTQPQAEQTQDRPGKTTRVEPTSQTQQKPEPKAEGDARLEQLIAQLEKQFVRNPDAARQTAVTLSVEFPDRFDAAWVLRIYEQIKDAAWRKDKIATVNAAWDDRPGTARAALAELRGKYRSDKQLLRWAKAMERQIEAHQTRLRLEADVHAWDRRPSPAQVAARELHRLWPRNYPKSWLTQIEKQIWQFQDVKWAAKISDAELTAALGENAIDWNDAPLEVKQELQIQLGRKKADLYYGKGGRGAKDDRALVLTDASRTEVLARSERVAPVDGDFKGWTKKEDIPVKRLEVVGQQYDKKADELLGSQIAQQQQSTNPLLANRPDVFTTLYNQSLVKQAEEYRQRGAQYQALVANIRSGATSIDAERKKIERDLAAIDWALRNQIPQLRAYEQEKEKGGSVDDKIAETRAYIEQLEKHEAVLKQVMSDPQGVIPGAGAVSAVMPTGPSMGAPDAATIQASRQVAQVTDTIQAWTGGENPEGIQKNLQEMAIGLTRLKGRFDMMSAGIYRMVGNLGSYVLPDSVTGPILGMADQMRALGMAFTTANTKFTKDGEAIQMKYVAEGGTIPMIDRVFSTQKIFEKPDVAILSFLQAMPQTKGVSLALQIGINAAQTVEAFFSTYGRTGQLTPAIQAAGWSAVQGTVGIVLDKLGVPPGAQLVANITMIYGFGKMRGLSNEQIQEEIAFALVATAVGAGTSATKRGSLSGIGGKSRDIVTAIEEGNGKQTLEEAPRMDVSEETLAKSQRIDDAANQLAAAIETQRTMMRELQVLQQSKQPTKQKLTEIESSMQTVNDRRAAMKTAMTEARTVGTSQIKVTTTEATPTRTTKPVEAESTTQPKELPKRDVPKDAKRWIEGDDGRQIYKLADETFIDGDGRVTDSDGTLIDKDGNWVDVYGRRVDGAGRLVDAQGNLIDAQGRLIDKTGKLVEAAEQASLSERDVIGNNFRAKFGEKVIAFRGIRVPKGTKVLGTYKGGSKHGQMIVFDAESALHYARNPAYDPPGGAAAADEIIVIQFEVTADQIVHDPYGTMEHVFVDTDITKLPGYKETRIAKDTVTDENEASIASQIRGGTTLK